MPATEQTYRDQKLLHVVFGVSSLVMLVATIWMLAADHRREWKQYQQTARRVETGYLKYQISQQNNEQYAEQHKRLEQALADARREIPDNALIEQFIKLVEDAAKKEIATPGHGLPTTEQIEAAYTNLVDTAPENRSKIRDELIATLNRFVVDAKFREGDASTKKKFEAASYDVSRSEFDRGVEHELPPGELQRLQEHVTIIKENLDRLADKVENLSTYRKDLEKIVAQITADETKIRKALEEHNLQIERLEKAMAERDYTWQKKLVDLPIINAFGGPSKPDQIWLPKLTIYNNFRDVPRFDRCTTCHQEIDKSAPGSPTDPGFPARQILTLSMATPAHGVDNPEDPAGRLKQVFGLQLADQGILKPDDVTISVVRPQSPAAKAMLAVGDVIVQVNDAHILDRAQAYRFLVDDVNWGQPLVLTVHRGLPNPYTSHPRLDLFVSDSSPHKKTIVGCTICHDGQGSGTEFKFASHTPNTPEQAGEWQREHGWYNDHHWIFPMYPRRFADSTCLKCHHDVTELESSERFPDPPAPKLMEGYHLIRQYGCFGCHEINGFDGPNRRIGPDLRAEPNYAAAAQALTTDKELSPQQKDLARTLVAHPEDDRARRALAESVRNDMLPAEEGEQPQPRLSVATRKLAGVLDDVETPGKLRKVGPSLRHVASKDDFDFLYSWISNPKDFRPTTRMPRFFGLFNHLEGKGLEASQRFEPLEIRGVTEYLLAKSQPFSLAEDPKVAGTLKAPDRERGKTLFETRGCLACHKHNDFPGSAMTQGPDLSQLKGKFGRKENKNGPEWLYTWLKNPNEYHPRTLMPNLILDPLVVKDDKGNPTREFTDPAADITVYLLGSGDWRPKAQPAELSKEEKQSLYELALDHLKAGYPKRKAQDYLQNGIPESQRGELKGDEIELVGDHVTEKQLTQKQLLYVGRRTISKYGCSGCHDIPGFEDSKPIGTGLADWGRKGADKLAFEQIVEYIKERHTGTGEHAGALPLSPADEQAMLSMQFANMSDQDSAFFLEKLFGHERPGFLWQKLREPRSYDYMKTQNKGYNERLRMPQFNLRQDQIESIMTFVLGLVSEPPATQYVYKASPRRQAVVDGKRIAEKYNCTGCHTLEMERWKVAFEPDKLPAEARVEDLSVPTAHFSPQQIAASTKPDTRGLLHATITGMPARKTETGWPVQYDKEGDLIEEEGVPVDRTKITLWDDVVVGGKVFQAGITDLEINTSQIEQPRYPAVGGFLPRLILRPVFLREKAVNSQADASVVWGWLPPPLVGEGRKVQTSWLHDFLLDPHPIRPATVLRMPKFNMSSAEATALAHYFAAVDDADYPFDFDPRTRESYLAAEESMHPNRFGDALKIVTESKKLCTQCHLMGDYSPPGSVRALGPQLDEVYKRLRPDYLRQWIANPKRILPYTGMPLNFNPADPNPDLKKLYDGDLREQLEAVVDLLLNYDRFSAEQRSIRKFIETTSPGGDTALSR